MTIKNFETYLEKYAEVVIKMGLNLNEGQKLLIGYSSLGNYTPVETAPFVRALTRQAYKAGAKYVEVIWDDRMLKKIQLDHGSKESLEEFPVNQAKTVEEYLANGDAGMAVYGQDPDLFEGQDPEDLAFMQKTANKYGKKISSMVSSNFSNWNIASAPVPGWSAKVFPGLSPEEAHDKLWEAIFKACRIYEDDPVAAWKKHLSHLGARAKYLTDKQYDALKLTGPGTDLTVGLAGKHVWRGGSVEGQNGITFTPNIPTEEVFSLPDMHRVEGTVSSTKPLLYAGNYMDEFTLTFSEGRVVDVKAKVGEENLKKIIATDENAARIGEIALVPHGSPISQSGLVFHNILYDENASNHIALGRGYRMNIKDGYDMPDEEFLAAGGNVSDVHADFMIGSGKMDVDGIAKDGSVEAVMRSGEWAVEV